MQRAVGLMARSSGRRSPPHPWGGRPDDAPHPLGPVSHRMRLDRSNLWLMRSTRVVKVGKPGSNKGRSNVVPLPRVPIVREVKILNLLAAVSKAKKQMLHEDAKTKRLVDEAKAAGCTWVQIGAALGVTPEAASATYRARHKPPPRRGRGRPPKVKTFGDLVDADQQSLPL